MGLTKQEVYIGDFYEKAQKLKATWGKTDLYSTGHSVLDNYFSGGFGRKDGYEIVLLYGPTGVGKSTVALNFLAPAIRDKINIGLLVLEDDMADVSNRLAQVLSDSEYDDMNKSNLVRCLPEDALTKAWNLKDLLKYIEDWFNDGVDLILLDHLQFAFENAEAVKGENEYIAQRVFMQSLNQLMKKSKKTIILVSHMNKAAGSKGMDRIVGSGALAQAATKVIQVVEDKDMPDTIRLELMKSRFTKKPGFDYAMKLVNSRLERSA